MTPHGYLVTEGLGGWFVTKGPAAPQFAISNTFHATREAAEQEASDHYDMKTEEAFDYVIGLVR